MGAFPVTSRRRAHDIKMLIGVMSGYILIPLRETDYFTVIEVIWGWGPSYQ